MTVRLPTKKAATVVDACQNLINQPNPTILLVAQVIGRIVSSFPAVPLGPLFYRNMEMAKDKAQKENDGNFHTSWSYGWITMVDTKSTQGTSPNNASG